MTKNAESVGRVVLESPSPCAPHRSQPLQVCASLLTTIPRVVADSNPELELANAVGVKPFRNLLLAPCLTLTPGSLSHTSSIRSLRKLHLNASVHVDQ